ncbi:MAG: DMT family transporter [Gammaproteobacteria bacterium]|nr:MAG: DMT family transporter [Gammaproteobacteria bacterium]UCH41869.1 MAG: DMT family transporter [Gammaproteobacteria bacterium]
MRAKTAITTFDATSGAIILVFGLFLFSIQDIIIKHFSSHYSVLQIVFARGLIALGLFMIFFRVTRERITLKSKRPKIMLARGLLGFLSYTSYYLAVAAMPLAEVVSITFTMPLFVTAMSALILREKVGIRRWSAVVVGFAGVLIILSPSGEFNSLAVVFAFIAAITYASQTILTRFLGDHDHPLSIAFNAILIFTVASGILSLLLLSGLIAVTSDHPSLAFFGREWVMPTDIDFVLMLLIGGIAAVGFYCLSKAYCSSEASAIAPFEFTYILWAVVFGYLFWNEVPGPTTIVGISILVSSSLYIWYRERRIERSETALVPVQAADLAQQDTY